MTTIGLKFSKHDGDSNEKGKKKTDRFRLAKQQLSRFFFYIFSGRSLHDCDMKLSNSTHPLYGVGKHNTKSFFFFF